MLVSGDVCGVGEGNDGRAYCAGTAPPSLFTMPVAPSGRLLVNTKFVPPLRMLATRKGIAIISLWK